jgi:hypothetical protein
MSRVVAIASAVLAFALAAGCCPANSASEAQPHAYVETRAHLLAVAVVGGDALEIVYDVSRLHGASGEW